MKQTAQAIVDWAFAELDEIARSRVYYSNRSLDKHVAELAGLSLGTVQNFRRGVHLNLSASNLDSLVAAVKIAKRKKAA